MKWKSFGSVVVFFSIVLFVSSCKKDEVTNLSKIMVAVALSLIALVEPKQIEQQQR
jgi:hypothetical protein